MRGGGALRSPCLVPSAGSGQASPDTPTSPILLTGIVNSESAANRCLSSAVALTSDQRLAHCLPVKWRRRGAQEDLQLQIVKAHGNGTTEPTGLSNAQDEEQWGGVGGPTMHLWSH